MNWIKCTEQLPETQIEYRNRKNIPCLVTTSKGKVTVCTRQYNRFYDMWQWSRNLNVTHWIKLPKGATNETV